MNVSPIGPSPLTSTLLTTLPANPVGTNGAAVSAAVGAAVGAAVNAAVNAATNTAASLTPPPVAGTGLTVNRVV
jgi:hypothetical protein